MSEELGITVPKSRFSEWYLEVIRKAKIVDQRYPVKGFPVYMPWATFMIREITRMFECELEAAGHEPTAFPVVIPESNLTKEKEHVKGFEDEVFWVTRAGKNKLEERLFLRPTSETAIYPMYSLWVRTYQDLPLKMFQACQVYRYETKMTKPLLRGREFFWIETHTVQKDHKHVVEQVKEDMEITAKVFKDKLGIPFLLYERPDWDKFPGAESTYAYDTVMPDGKILQVATTHDLGTHFSKPFNITFIDENEEKHYAHQTCFGLGISRQVAAVISIHGDDKGLVLPPEVSPVQIVIIPILIKGKEKMVSEKAGEILGLLECDYRVKLDDRNYRPGFKFNEWELKGVPIRIEIGPEDVENKEVQIARRDTGEKITVKEEDVKKVVVKLFDNIFNNIKNRAEKFFKNSIHEATTLDKLKKELKKGGFVKIPFCSTKTGHNCAKKIKDEACAEVRGRLFDNKKKPEGKCIICNKKAEAMVYVAKAY